MKFDKENKLTNEELESVSGGLMKEIAEDSRFLNVLLRGRPEQCDRYGEWRIAWGDHDVEIAKAWAAVGVNVGFDRDGDNGYCIINGEAVTQEEARQYAMNFVGRHLKRSDWDW